MPLPTVEPYHALLGHARFAESHTLSQSDDKYFKSLDEMVAWIDQPCLVPLLASIDDEEWKRLCDTVINQMIKRTKQANGTLFETFPRLNVSARR